MPAFDNATLKSVLTKVKNDANSMLILAGHSLGGAAALVYGAMAIESGVPKGPGQYRDHRSACRRPDGF